MDIKKILRDNPKVDRNMLEDASKLYQKLKKLDLVRRSYRLHSRSLRPADNTENSRTVHLRQKQK